MAAIAISGVTKRFDQTQVLNGIDLTIQDGEFLTLVGPSGCGKSTLLRIIAGLEAQSGGDVHIGDRLVNGVRASDRNLAMVFQSYALYPHLTVAENMATPLKLRDLSFWQRLPIAGPLLSRARHLDVRSQVEDTAKVLRIEALLDRKPGQLSGGQRQRAALGRAMVRKPVAFLMDEPLSNLDAALRVHMRAEIAELHRALGVTFVYVTHDQAEALTMSNRMAVMQAGDILQCDRPQVIYDDPVDLRVAEFVGSPKINTLPGEADNDGRVSCLGAPLERRLDAWATGSVTIGVRPEHMTVVPTGSPATIAGRVTHREHLGADIYLHLAIADGAHRMVVRALPNEAGHIAIGDDVHAARVRGETMAFATDGKRLRFASGEAEPAREAAVA